MEQCTSCGSKRILRNVRIVDRGHGNAAQDLSVEIYEHPDALIFKGTHKGALQATICGDCGHTDLTVTNAGELYATYLSLRTGPTD
jgi:hypothetical protein